MPGGGPPSHMGPGGPPGSGPSGPPGSSMYGPPGQSFIKLSNIFDNSGGILNKDKKLSIRT